MEKEGIMDYTKRSDSTEEAALIIGVSFRINQG